MNNERFRFPDLSVILARLTEKNNIKKEIKDYVQSCATGSLGWYIGIATDPRQRLFKDHNVNENTDAWIYKKATTCEIARDAEIELIEELKTKGDCGGGSNTTVYVYAYRITPSTRE